jgi:hypothetical protein
MKPDYDGINSQGGGLEKYDSIASTLFGQFRHRYTHPQLSALLRKQPRLFKRNFLLGVFAIFLVFTILNIQTFPAYGTQDTEIAGCDFVLSSDEALSYSDYTYTDNVLTIQKGKTKQLKLKVIPAKATDLKVTFKSNKKKIVSVDKAGMLTALKKGKAKITVKVGNKTFAKTVTVK